MIGILLASAILAANPLIGFGIGEELGYSLLSPSIFTLRIAAGEKYILSPAIKIDYSLTDDAADDTESYDLELGFGMDLHRAIRKSDRNGLYAIVGMQALYGKEMLEMYNYTQPESLYTIKETKQEYFLKLGLGMEYFLKRNLSVSITTLSGIGLKQEKREREIDGQEEYASDRFTRVVDIQSLGANVYIIWYL